MILPTLPAIRRGAYALRSRSIRRTVNKRNLVSISNADQVRSADHAAFLISFFFPKEAQNSDAFPLRCVLACHGNTDVYLNSISGAGSFERRSGTVRRYR